MKLWALSFCALQTLPGPEAYDTANILIRYPGGKEAIIDVCRQAPYGDETPRHVTLYAEAPKGDSPFKDVSFSMKLLKGALPV